MPRRILVPLLLLIALALLTSFGTPSTILLAQGGTPTGAQATQATTKVVPSPGLYSLYDYRNLDPASTHLVGGHQSKDWRLMESSEGNYTWGSYDNWIAQEAAKGKPVALGVEIYTGGDSNNRRMPDYVYQVSPPVICNGREVPRYWDPNFLAKYRQFILAFGDHYRNDPRVAWVQIGAGIYQETQPETWQYKEPCVRDAMAADLGVDPSNRTALSAKWVEVVNSIQQAYKDAFGDSKPVLLQHAPAFLDYSEKHNRYNQDGSLLWEGWVDYAAARGIGLKHAGLLADHPNRYSYDDQENNYQAVAIAFEPGGALGQTYEIYWALLNALNNHADYVALFPCHFSSSACSDPVFANLDRPFVYDLYDFFNAHAGVTLETTPDVFVALRESWYDYGDRDNYNFWLSQDHQAPGGKSQGVIRTDTPPCSPQREKCNADIEIDTSLPDHPYSAWTRRTDQGSGNPFMYFNVDDGYIFGGPTAVEINVTYLDRGTDKWRLSYDSTGGEKLAWEQTKSGSNTWKTVTFTVDDAAFSNGIAGNDLRLDSTGDGDDYFHMIRLRRTSPPPTPTPTPTPTATPIPQICPTGDVNGDGQVNADDVQLVAAHWLQQKLEYDLANDDGLVTIADIMVVADQFGDVCYTP